MKICLIDTCLNFGEKFLDERHKIIRKEKNKTTSSDSEIDLIFKKNTPKNPPKVLIDTLFQFY